MVLWEDVEEFEYMKIGKEDVLDVEEVVDPQILKRDGNNKNDTEGKANGRRNEKQEFPFI